MSLTSIDLGLEELLADPVRRNSFFRSITQDEIASQIRELRRERNLTQVAFARLVDMKQSAVSRIEKAEHAAWNLTTLFRVAEALDARWKIALEKSEDAVAEYLPFAAFSHATAEWVDEASPAKAALAFNANVRNGQPIWQSAVEQATPPRPPEPETERNKLKPTRELVPV
jgi:transcriptional regulator with XRE-family HTH domain